MKPELWVARHPKVDAEGLCYGQTDVRAIPPPEESAAAIEAELRERGVRPDTVLTSPWSRTRDTATVLARTLNVPLLVEPRISELHFGVWEGVSYAELSNDAAFRTWTEAWTTLTPPGGESVAMLMERVRAWAAELTPATTLAITHAGVIRALRAIASRAAAPPLSFEAVPHLALEQIDVWGGFSVAPRE